ncbi:MAG: hypothetical protein EOT05_02130 [Candidatus Microsaccharimonas sossegonensis]|uniref:Uncharacterized protein n=1 Tax=Candidatus Microsaccharimonas sossegonensis TaxID=2506948 RepID=A0A4V1J7F7_9BACT|nr:MAG: hypothetical protein EOT05_02130 [Candidatus Microsaccharimonas sossegonensis]
MKFIEQNEHISDSVNIDRETQARIDAFMKLHRSDYKDVVAYNLSPVERARYNYFRRNRINNHLIWGGIFYEEEYPESEEHYDLQNLIDSQSHTTQEIFNPEKYYAGKGFAELEDERKEDLKQLNTVSFISRHLAAGVIQAVVEG